MTTIAIIPARGGSRRIPRKNIRPFFGKPIIAYSIEAARESGLFHAIYVSTDDEEVAKVATGAGAAVMYRPTSYASLGTQEVVAAGLKTLKKLPETACCIYATAPLMSVADLVTGWATLGAYRADEGFAMSVGTKPLRDAAQFYWGYSSAFLKAIPLIDHRTRMVPVDENRVCDINTEFDWQRCENLYARLHPECTRS